MIVLLLICGGVLVLNCFKLNLSCFRLLDNFIVGCELFGFEEYISLLMIILLWVVVLVVKIIFLVL